MTKSLQSELSSEGDDGTEEQQVENRSVARPGLAKPPKGAKSLLQSLTTAFGSSAGGGSHSMKPFSISKTRTFKSTVLQSRIDVLQKTLKFKTWTGCSSRSPRRGSPQTSMLAPRLSSGQSDLFGNFGGAGVQPQHPKLKITTSLLSRKNVSTGSRPGRTTTVIGKTSGHISSTPFGRNIRKEMAESKFDGLAMLFQRKMDKMEASGDSDCGEGADEDKDALHNGNDSEEEHAQTLFERPAAPKLSNSRRLPSPWLTRDSLIVPDRKRKQKNLVPKLSPARDQQNSPVDSKEESTDDLLDEVEEQDCEQSEVASSSFSSVLEDISAQVLQLEQQNLLQRKISFLLREFYTNIQTKAKKGNNSAVQDIAPYLNEIVFANKCLLVAVEKQSLIEQDIRQIQARRDALRGKPPTVRFSEGFGGNGRGCLALRSICLPLRHRSASTFLFCLVRMQSNSKLAESIIRNTLTHSTKVRPARDEHNKSTVHFNLNELYYELEPNFELSVKFYQMDLSTDGQCGPLYRLVYRQLMNELKNKSSQVSNLAKRMMHKKAALKSVKPKKDNMLGLFDASNGELKMTNVASVNMDNVLLAGSAFKPIGSLSVNRSNWAASPLSIDQFDFSWSASDHKATIDCDLSIDYGPNVEPNQSFGVHFESRTVDPSLSKGKLQKHLHFGKSKFKFHKCTMLIEKRYLRVRSKGSSIKFDLACCLNPMEPSIGANPAPNIRGLSHQTVCLVFTGALQPVATGNTFSDPYPNLRLKDEKAKMNGFQFVFITSPKADRLSEFYQHVLCRAHSVREWNSPVVKMHSSSLLALANTANGGHSSLLDKHDDHSQQYGNAFASATLYRTLIDNLKVF